jgi:ribosomal RNA-processing protein 8
LTSVKSSLINDISDIPQFNMFSVSGWSVSANNLKSEATGASAAASGSNATPVHSKKRKRPGHKLKVAVTGDNVAELWEQFVENKKPKIEGGKSDKPQAKKVKKAKKDSKPEATTETQSEAAEQQPEESDEWNGVDGDEKEVTEKPSEDKAVPDKSPKPRKDQKPKDNNQKPKDNNQKPKENNQKPKDNNQKPKDNNEKEQQNKPAKDIKNEGQPKSNKDDSNNAKPKAGKEKKKQNAEEATISKQLAAPPKPAAPKLTPLQASMREKLISARFRHLNETLYTKPSAEAFKLFKTSPDMFVEYHEGFRRQVSVWPENPVEGYIRDIIARGRVRQPWSGGRGNNRRPPPAPTPGTLQPLGRTNGTCYIADLGCGDANLAAALKPHSAKMHLDVRSFDLQTNGNPLVTAADMANLPLPDGSVDIAIFCLALMGTNWVDFVEEAYRILRWKGELWVAEIKSRFTIPGKGGKKVVDHSVGNRRKPAAGVLPPGAPIPGPKSKKGKANAAEEAAAAETELAIEVDGEEDKRQQTDVSAFVEVLAKRGFVLRGDAHEAVDLSNKMFVKMYFVKGASPVKGKGVEALKAREGQGSAKPAFMQKKKFINDEVEVDEAAVLKPCVYKIR